MAKILIIDDTKFMRTVLRSILESLGHDIVAEGKNGEEAIVLAEGCNPDIVTLDIRMPKMDGVTAIPEIRKVCPDVKILIVSVIDDHEKILEAVKNGANEYILKPFRKDRIVSAINKLHMKEEVINEDDENE